MDEDITPADSVAPVYLGETVSPVEPSPSPMELIAEQKAQRDAVLAALSERLGLTPEEVEALGRG